MASLNKLFRIQMGQQTTLTNVPVTTESIGTMYVSTDQGLINVDVPDGSGAKRIILNAN